VTVVMKLVIIKNLIAKLALGEESDRQAASCQWVA
jgi:hypothetical protein